jgi:hypothetical protein
VLAETTKLITKRIQIHKSFSFRKGGGEVKVLKFLLDQPMRRIPASTSFAILGARVGF